MENIFKKYENKLRSSSHRDATFKNVVSLEDAILSLREALEEYKGIYKSDRRFDFWGNEIF